MLCTDARTGTPFEFQAQHLLSSGLVDLSWSPDSSQLCLGSADGIHNLLVPDGVGGAYVAWVDSRLGAPDIYLTRLTISGTTAAGWPEGGFPVCSAPLSQYNLDACSDGAGGVLLAWQDFRSGHASQVYAARIGADHGVAAGWTDGGVPLASGAADQYSPRIVADGAGGAFVIWQSREASGLGARIQHLSSSSTVAQGWPSAGAPILPGQEGVAGVSLSRESTGQLQLLWRGAASGGGLALKSALLDPSSAPDSASTPTAVTLSSGAIEISEPRLARLADGTLLVSWAEWREGQGILKAQMLSAGGGIAPNWPAGGLTIADSVAVSTPAILPVSGGAIIAWEDLRAGTGPDIYAARVTEAGTLDTGWESGGVPICTAAGVQYAPALSADGNGGAIAVWSDAVSEASGSFLAARQSGSDPARLIRVETNSGYARITWEIAPGSGELFPAYRAIDAGEWTLLKVLALTDSSRVVLEDPSAPLGAEVQYRLAIQAQGSIRFLAPVIVHVPADPVRLELTRAWPSGNGQGIEIAFSLPRGPVAKVEVFDVMGRRVGELSLNQFAPGIRAARVPMGAHAASAIYFVRLSQGSRSSTRRVVFLR